jgi:hypothetical protein
VAVAVLDGDYLSAAELAMLRTFVEACRMIDVFSITEQQASDAHGLFGKFVRQFSRIYGQDKVTPNMHYHSHLLESILDHGPLPSIWGFVWEQLTGRLVSTSTNGRQVNIQFCKSWEQQERVFNIDAYFACAKEMSADERRLLAELGGSRQSKLAPLPLGFDLGVSLSLPLTKNTVTGSEPLLVRLISEKTVEIAELDRRGLVAALARLYPKLCDASGKFRPAVGAEMKCSDLADINGERFGSVGSRRERCSFVAALFDGEKLGVGRVLRFAQFQIGLPTDEKADSKARQVTHNFVQVRWFRFHGARYDKLAPEFKVADPYTDVKYQWIPMHRIACRVAPRFITRGSTRTFIACLLTRKPVLLVPD